MWERGLLVKELAEQINYPRSTVSRVLSGKKSFRFVRAAIVEALDMDKSFIWEGTL